MIPTKNILYIGPYKEESNRGYYSYTNIKALEKAGHKLKIIPTICHKQPTNKAYTDIVHLEKNNFDKYDTCIQHCDASQYSYNKNFEQNIAVYDFANVNPNPIINSRFLFFDKILVTSQNKLEILAETIAASLYPKIQFAPQLLDLNHIQNHSTEDTLEWLEDGRFYFYVELDFSEQYDWEKLIYVYLTTFMNKKTGLIIKTIKLDNQDKVNMIKKQVEDIAQEANVKPIPKAMPQVLNGEFNEYERMKVYNSIDCFIDINKANEQSYAAVICAALNKPIICNANLTTASYFKNSFKVAGLLCNSPMNYHEDIMNNSISSYYYSLDAEHLRDTMMQVYQNRLSAKDNEYYKDEINLHDISNINNIL